MAKTSRRRARKRKNTALILITALLLIVAAGAVVLVSVIFKNQKPAWAGGYSVHISEVMTDNDSCPDPSGALCDWVEIANTDSRPAELGGFGLSDQEGKMKYVFPAGTTVPAEGFLVVWCSSDLEGSYAPFALKKDGGETVYLMNPNAVAVDKADTAPCAPGQSLIRSADGALVPCDEPTPGYSNDAAGRQAYLASRSAGSSGELLLSEIMSSNSLYPAPDGSCPDWVEIFNPTDHAVSLAGYKLSDREDKSKYDFPDGMIGSGEYLVVWCGQGLQGDYAAPFALAGDGGETVTLTGPDGLLCDSAVLPPLESDTSWARTADGWVVSDKPTPGWPNTSEGYAAWLASDASRTAEVYITEVVAKNQGSGTDADGELSDWIELANLGETDVSLTGWHLSDKEEQLTQWTIPELTLAPGEYVRIFASGKNRTQGELHTSFALSAGETLFLTTPTGTVLRSVAISELGDGESLVLRPDGSFASSAYPTPGMANTAESYTLFAQSDTRSSPLLIWEAVVYDPDGDWVELKNTSDTAVDLSGYYLTDNLKKPEKYQYLSGSLAPGQLLVVPCENYSLSASGDTLYLCRGDGTLCDWTALRSIPLNGSYGRLSGETGYFFFEASTRGAENAQGWRMVAMNPSADVPAGVYDEAESLTVALSGDSLYFTTDGSTPTRSSQAYTGPLTIADTTVIRVRSFPDGQLPSETLTLSYFLRENSTMPIVSLVTDSGNLFGPKGIYSNHETAWLNEWERDANVSMYDDAGSFNIDCGIKIHGRTSRKTSDKRSITLKFRGRYGGDLHYDVFGDGQILDFSSLILRGSVEDAIYAYYRDALFADMAMDFTNVPAQNYRYVSLFINGEYWGVYAIREQHNKNYFANHYGVDPETVEVFNGENRWPGAFDDLLKYAESHVLTDPEAWQYIKDHLNVEEMIDWLILECYGGDIDVYENVRFYSSPEYDNGRIMFGLADMDLTMMNHDTYAVGFERWGQLHSIIPRGLLYNTEFRDMFLTRLGSLLQNELSDQAVLDRLHKLTAIVEPETARELARWSQDRATYDSRVNNIENFIQDRAWEMANSARAYFGLSQEQGDQYFGTLGR